MRKMMMVDKVLQPRYNMDRLYVTRKEARRGLSRIEEYIYVIIQGLQEYTKSVKRD